MYAAVSKLLPVILRCQSGALVMTDKKNIYVRCPVCGYEKWVEMDFPDPVECPNDCMLKIQDYEDLLLKTKTEIFAADACKQFWLRKNTFTQYWNDYPILKRGYWEARKAIFVN